MPKCYNQSKIGNTYNCLTVVELAYIKDYKKFFKCECTCGSETVVSMSHLVTGHTKSCGCLNTHTGNTRHEQAGTNLYKRYYAMIDRCHNPKASNFGNYGKKGIQVCDEWRKDFIAFKAWAEKSGYTPDLTIDRIDNTQGYSPQNCRWVNYTIQAVNKGLSVRNTSSVKGVSFHKVKQLWIGRVSIDGTRVETCKDPLFENAVKLHLEYLHTNCLYEHLKAIQYANLNNTRATL